MIRENNNSPVADFKVIGCDTDTLVAKLLHFIAEVLQVDNRSIAEYIDRTVVKNAGRNQIQRELYQIC